MKAHTNSFPHLPYRPCVGVALFNKKGEVFVGERCDNPGAWQMPQGGIEEGESIEKAALRELKEETGSDNAEILQICNQKYCYDLPDRLVKKIWGGKYRGQEQTWIAARFLGEDSEIDIAAHEPQEFLDWQWIPFDKVLDFIVPFKRNTYELVICDFSDHAIPVE